MNPQNTTIQIPSVSIIITAYNIEQYIERAINSVIAQTYAADEIIVIDDGSTDGTAEIIKRYGNKIKYIYQKNAGPSAARNKGIKTATCTWVTFLDGDDEWLPEHLKLYDELLQKSTGLCWCAGNFYRHLETENRKSQNVSNAKIAKHLNSDIADDYLILFSNGIWSHTNNIMLKRDAMLETGLFRQDMKYAEDIDMWLRFAIRHGRIGYVKQPTSIYHLHRPGSLVYDTKRSDKFEVVVNLIDDLLKDAKKHGRDKEFAKSAKYYLKRTIRASLFHAQLSNQIAEAIKRFKDILPFSYRLVIGLAVRFPKATETLLKTISFVVRKLNLRSRVVRKHTA